MLTLREKTPFVIFTFLVSVINFIIIYFHSLGEFNHSLWHRQYVEMNMHYDNILSLYASSYAYGAIIPISAFLAGIILLMKKCDLMHVSWYVCILLFLNFLYFYFALVAFLGVYIGFCHYA